MSQTPHGLLTLEVLDALRGPGGARLLEEASLIAADPFAAEKLRRLAPAHLAAAAVEQVRLRRRAAARFTAAERMWFSPALLEQASGEEIAVYRARRFAGETGGPVADLCCGLGSDAVALAAARRVVAVDRDPLALALARANAESLRVGGRIELRPGEVPADVPDVTSAWIDPGRREGGRRTRAHDQMSPPLAALLPLREQIPAIGIKLSPAADHAALDGLLSGIPHEREALSVGGECRELILWIGALAGDGPRRATLLPGAATLAGEPLPLPELGAGGYLLEPDGAVLRAGLVGNLARQLGAHALDSRLAYLVADRPEPTPFGKWYRVEPAQAFSERRLSAWLRSVGAADVVLKTRGSAIEPETLRRRLGPVLKQGEPGRRPVVFLTRLAGRPVMIAGERVGAGPEPDAR